MRKLKYISEKMFPSYTNHTLNVDLSDTITQIIINFN